MQNNSLQLISTMDLFKWRGIYSFMPYLPSIGYLRKKETDQALKESTSFVYKFKKSGAASNMVELMVFALGKMLDCNLILAIPPSEVKKQPNSLQKLFGEEIRRVKEVSSRKYNHTKRLDKNYKKSILFPDVGPDDKILLIDDICTTGKTLDFFRDEIEGRGAKVESAAIGIYWKLNFKKIIQLIIFKERNDLDNELDNLLKSLS